MDWFTQKKMKNLFYVKPDGPQDWREINEWISTYGGSKETIDFIGNSDRTLELLWELVTAKCGCVTFEYTIGACIVTGGGKHGQPSVKVTAGTVGRALANLFLEYMKREAQGNEFGSRAIQRKGR